MIWIIISLILNIANHNLTAQEFDFDDDDENKVNQDRFTIPLDLKISLREAYQINPERHIETGLNLYKIFDYTQNGLRLRIEGTAHYNGAYQLEGDDQAVIDEHQIEWVPREFFLSYNWQSWTFLVGKKIKVLGKTDFLSPLDIISPKDNTKLLFATPEESRVGQDLLSADYTKGSANLWIGMSLNHAYDRLPISGHPYGGPAGQYPDREITEGKEEYYGKFSWTKEQLEWSIISAHSHIRSPLALTKDNGHKRSLGYHYPKYDILGLGLTQVWNPILLKLELGFSPEFPDVSLDNSEIIKEEVLFVTTGIDWNHDQYGNLMIESSVNQSITGGQSQEILTNTSRSVISWSGDFWNDNGNISLILMTIDSSKNRIGRCQFKYRPRDNLELQLSTTLIAMEDPKITFQKNWENFDRIEASVNWVFSFAKP